MKRSTTRPICLSLFDYSGTWAHPWMATHSIILVDNRHPPGLRHYANGVNRIGVDINCFATMYLNRYAFHDVDCILAAPPCTHFSKAGARLWPEKDADGRTREHLHLVHATLDIIGAIQPRVWALENPVGRLANLTGTGLMQKELGLPAYTFDPCDHGDPWRKRTYLWGKFTPPAQHPVEPEPLPEHVGQNNRNHVALLHSTDERRRTTPEGFARDFYLANRGRP